MKKLIVLLCILTPAVFGQLIPPATTPYTRTWLRSADAPEGRSNLGIGSVTNQTYNLEQFKVDAATQANLRVSVLMTNALFRGVGNTSALQVIGKHLLPTGTNILYVSHITGDDANTQKGNPQRPWKELSNAVASASAGDLIYLFPERFTNHWVNHSDTASGSASIPINNKKDLVIWGYGATVFWPTCISGINIFGGSSNIAILGLTLEQPVKSYTFGLPPWSVSNLFAVNPGKVFGYIEVADASQVLIKDCVLKNGWDHGILAVTHRTSTSYATNVVIQNNRIYDCGSCFNTNGGGGDGKTDGAGIVYNQGWIVQGNLVEGGTSNLEGFPDMVADWTHVPAAIVTGNTLRRSLLCGIQSGRLRTIIANNIIERRTNDPVLPTVFMGATDAGNYVGLDYKSGCESLVKDNYVRGFGRAMHVALATNTTFQGNVLLEGQYGLIVENVESVKFINNTWRNFWGYTALGQGTYVNRTVFLDNSFIWDSVALACADVAQPMLRMQVTAADCIVKHNLFRSITNHYSPGLFVDGSSSILWEDNQFSGSFSSGQQVAYGEAVYLPVTIRVKSSTNQVSTLYPTSAGYWWPPDGSLAIATNGVMVRILNAWHVVK